jgi:predicted membrane protein
MGNVRMRLSPRPLLGRINGINVMVGGALATATAIVVGVVATNVGVRWPLTIFGTISTTSLALQLWKFQRAQKEVPAYVSDI